MRTTNLPGDNGLKGTPALQQLATGGLDDYKKPCFVAGRAVRCRAGRPVQGWPSGAGLAVRCRARHQDWRLSGAAGAVRCHLRVATHHSKGRATHRARADVAQLVEQRIRNAWVGGSSPFIGTSRLSNILFQYIHIQGVLRGCRAQTGPALTMGLPENPYSPFRQVKGTNARDQNHKWHRKDTSCPSSLLRPLPDKGVKGVWLMISTACHGLSERITDYLAAPRAAPLSGAQWKAIKQMNIQ